MVSPLYEFDCTAEIRAHLESVWSASMLSVLLLTTGLVLLPANEGTKPRQSVKKGSLHGEEHQLEDFGAVRIAAARMHIRPKGVATRQSQVYCS
jgi:hypothetical protein